MDYKLTEYAREKVATGDAGGFIRDGMIYGSPGFEVESIHDNWVRVVVSLSDKTGKKVATTNPILLKVGDSLNFLELVAETDAFVW